MAAPRWPLRVSLEAARTIRPDSLDPTHRPMRLLPALLLTTCLAAPLHAQMGMGGMGGRRMDGGMGQMGRNALPKFATTNEMQTFNAADALLKDAGKLKLTEAQVTALTSLRGALYERNADLMVRYDSVRRNFKIPKALESPNQSDGTMPSQQEMAALGEQMRFMVNIAEQIAARRPEQIAQCLAVLDPSQHDRANKVLADQSDDLKKATPHLPTRR
jgi:hypothetical protein